MGEYLFRQRQACGHQERRPVDSVEAQNVFTDQMSIDGPELVEVLRAIGISKKAVRPDIKVSWRRSSGDRKMAGVSDLSIQTIPLRVMVNCETVLLVC